MSLQAMTWAYDQDAPTVAKFLLVTLANYANEHGQCWPSKAKLAQMMGCDERTVHRNLHTLSEGGLISIQHRFKDGVQITSIITLGLEFRSGQSGDSGAGGGGAGQGVGADCQGGAAQGVGALVSKGGGTAPHRTFTEPNITLLKGRETFRDRETSPRGTTPQRAPSVSETSPPPEPKATAQAAPAEIIPPPASPPPIDSHALHARLVAAAGPSLYQLALGLVAVSEPISWLKAGADLELDVLPIVQALGARARPGSIRSWNYFAPAVSEAKARRERGLPAPSEHTAAADPYMPAWKAEKLRKAEAWRAALRARGYLS